jgi:hypothetical protein
VIRTLNTEELANIDINIVEGEGASPGAEDLIGEMLRRVEMKCA